jgi:hypothetical protein
MMRLTTRWNTRFSAQIYLYQTLWLFTYNKVTIYIKYTNTLLLHYYGYKYINTKFKIPLMFGTSDAIYTNYVGYPFSCFARPDSFRRYQGRRVPFSCFARPDSFSAVPRVPGLVFMFYAPELVFDDNDGVVSRFHVLRSRTHFRRHRQRRVPLSCFALPNTFSAVRRASSLVFMFCASVLIFGGTEGVRSCFHVLRARTRFRW